MLIDDDPDDQEIFLSALAKVADKVACETVDSGIDALHRLQQNKVLPECIFLDLNMPIMTGQEFLVEIKKLPGLKEIPVIIFSTTSHTKIIASTRALGAHDFITKPDKFQDLIEIMKRFFLTPDQSH